MKRIIYLMSMLWLGSLSPAHSEAVNEVLVQPLDWNQLMPAYLSNKGELMDQNESDLMFDARQFAELVDDPMAALKEEQALNSSALSSSELSPSETVPTLDGQMVRIPGFVVPLVEDGLKITEFFLVPYFGACIHVPPPPANQMIHVTIKSGINIDSIYDAISVVGKLQVATVANEMGTAGYTLQAVKVEPYQEQMTE